MRNLRRIWYNMLARTGGKRCDKQHPRGYEHVERDPRWGDYQTFIRDVTQLDGWLCPSHTSLDRIVPQHGYRMTNCRWVRPGQAGCARRTRRSSAECDAELRAEFAKLFRPGREQPRCWVIANTPKNRELLKRIIDRLTVEGRQAKLGAVAKAAEKALYEE